MKNSFCTFSRGGQNGSALFLILIAVALFAGLSFALVKSWNNSSASSMGSQEQDRLTATEIIQYGDGFRPIIEHMLLLGGASDTNSSGNGILFSATGANSSYGTPGAQPTTEIFNTSGGKMPYLTPPAAACNSTCAYEFSGQYTITGVGSDSKAELVMLVIDLTKGVCQKANALLGLSWSSIPTGGALTLTRFNGTNYGDLGGANPITLTGGANEFVRQRTFCYQESSGAGRYIYVHVIHSR